MAVAGLTGERLDGVNKSARCGCVEESPHDWGMVWSAGARRQNIETCLESRGRKAGERVLRDRMLVC